MKNLIIMLINFLILYTLNLIGMEMPNSEDIDTFIEELMKSKERSLKRADNFNPILTPQAENSLYCPIKNKEIYWKSDSITNPAAIVHEGKVYLFYSAQDHDGVCEGIGTSRIGLAISIDGLTFTDENIPVISPNYDEFEIDEWPGGCQNPRVVATKKGKFIMTYTQWNAKIAILGIANSKDLRFWKKKGYAFEKANNFNFGRRWSKSGSIISKFKNGKQIAKKLNGKYWMYWGEGEIYIAISNDLINWEPLLDQKGNPIIILAPQDGCFDSLLLEPGPSAIIIDEEIILLYNGKNSSKNGDITVEPDSYSIGMAIFTVQDPTLCRYRSKKPILKPERFYETKRDSYKFGKIYASSLIFFNNSWFVYYGCSDWAIAAAQYKGAKLQEIGD